MIKITDKRKCTSCSACYHICPVNAIKMKEDSEGFFYPEVDEEKCIHCNLCEKTCPVINQKKNEKRELKPKVIAAWSKNQPTRLDSTSGGIFSELAKAIYKENGVVCGAVYNKEWEVEHIISESEEDIDNLRSSKYLQSNIKDVFCQIKNKLKLGKKVLICGSPCQISGLYQYLQKDYENLYTCDFICRGMNSPKVFKGYIQYLENKYHSKVKKVKFKNKINGWHNFSTRIDFENGKKYIKSRYLDSYMIGYLKYNAFMRPSCYDCKFKTLPRVADITLADFWGIENIAPELDNDMGTSMILINSSKGKELFDFAKENIHYTEINSEKVFEENVCITDSVEMTEARNKVFENINKMDYIELSKNFFPSPKITEKIKIQLRYHSKLKIMRKIVKPIYKKIKGGKK